LEFSRFCAEDFTPQLMRKHRLNDVFQQIQVLAATSLLLLSAWNAMNATSEEFVQWTVRLFVTLVYCG